MQPHTQAHSGAPARRRLAAEVQRGALAEAGIEGEFGAAACYRDLGNTSTAQIPPLQWLLAGFMLEFQIVYYDFDVF